MIMGNVRVAGRKEGNGNFMSEAKKKPAWKSTALSVALLAFSLGACAGLEEPPEEWLDDTGTIRQGPRDSIFGEGGLTIFGGDQPQKGTQGGGIGVNAFLWRASLDTVAIWPVNSADPFGGVILTDWYAPPETPDERLKVNVYILDRALRADGIRVSVFRQVRDRAGGWRDAEVHRSTATKLENAILMRARQFRFETRQ